MELNGDYTVDQEFPVLDEEQGTQGSDVGNGQHDGPKPYLNRVFPNDAITRCDGFINDLKSHTKDDETFFFVRVGLIQGSTLSNDQKWRGDITNCDLLVGSTLKKWAEKMGSVGDALEGIRVNFTIKNLKYIPELYEGNPVLRSRGILEKVSFGRLDYVSG